VLAGCVIYPGSFDPITHGHIDVIRRGLDVFGKVMVAVGNNPAKNYFFDLDERVRLVEDICNGLSGVEVICFSGLLIDVCKKHNAHVILRGLRALSDFDIEFRNGLANRDMAGVETLFLLAEPSNIFLSSSLVKEIAAGGGDVSRYVPPVVVKAIAAAQKGSS